MTSNDVVETVQKGNIAIIKHTDDGETQIETPEVGAEFIIYLKSAGSYDAADPDERDVIICDENGFGQTKDMPYGVYTVHQTKGWDGRELMKDFDVFIAKDGQTYRYLINNANFESYVRVVKVDAETGNTIPYAGAGFQIYDPSGNIVKMTFTYPTPTTIDTFYTDAEGSLVTPEKLPYGQGYSIVEVEAPYGYVLDSTPIYFDIVEENSTEESGVTVIKVSKPNMAQKGTITVEKSGEVFFGVSVVGGVDVDGNELPMIYQPQYQVQGLPGAVYEIRAAEDIITPDGTLRAAKGELVDTVTTDEKKELVIATKEEWDSILAVNRTLPRKKRRFFIDSKIKEGANWDRMFIETSKEEYDKWHSQEEMRRRNLKAAEGYKFLSLDYGCSFDDEVEFEETIASSSDLEEEIAGDMFMADLRTALAVWKDWANSSKEQKLFAIK